MERRTLGKTGIETSALGLGCWAIGGPFYSEGRADGWGEVDDGESVAAIRRALDLGVDLLDTSDSYGIGHSEEVIGKAIAGRAGSVRIATKFGHFGNAATRTLHGTCLEPDYVERACDASLRRLGVERIDLYQLHVWEIGISQVDEVADVLDRLVAKGKIGAYGWSTDLAGGARLMAGRPGCAAAQFALNAFQDSPAMVALCEEAGLAGLVRSPLAMGLLTGKFGLDSVLPKDDVRGAGHAWVPFFKDGRPDPEALRRLESVREILTSGGRTPAQGALAWIWARSPRTIPLPGFRTVAQAEENARALEKGPLSPALFREVEALLGRT